MRLAVDAVMSEPVSRSNFPVCREFTRKNRVVAVDVAKQHGDNRLKLRAHLGINADNRQLGTGNNRETEQGTRLQ
jgi:hypothetical protein